MCRLCGKFSRIVGIWSYEKGTGLVQGVKFFGLGH